MIFHFTNNFDLHNCSRDRIELVRGDSPYVVARVHGQRVIGSACFGLYDQGDFGGSALANVTQFVTVPGDDYVDYIGILALNTDALTALVGAKDTVEVAGEWEIKYADDSGNIITVTPEKVEVLVSNDYIRQSPPSPVDPEDAYATEKFVEEVLKERVAVETEAALGGIRDDAEAAAIRAEEARDTTKLSESAAGVSSESARSHALSSQDSASRASGSAGAAKRSELACDDYARLSRESATNAATSSVAAKNAAGDAQTAAKKAEDVAGSLGGEVAEAKQSAVEAKASATSAATSAATAKTEVGKIGNSVSTAQTSATNAAASANTASGHATTAGTKATQAATSATNAGNSETKAKASETAAGTSATNAANSATTASGHASTASAKATQAGTSATAASASATQAAGSASAAQGSASTATTKATQAAGSATSAATSSTQAGTARDAAVTAKIAAEAAADRAEAASSGGVTDAQVNTKISTHNTAAAAHSTEMSKKLDKPTGGTTGQVLTKTATGTAWSDAAGGGGGGDKTAYMYSKSYNTGPDGKWEQLCAKNPPNGIYKVYIEAGGLHPPNGISIAPSEILSSVSAKFTNGAAYGTASDGSEGVTNLFGHRFEHTPSIGFSHISYINVQFIYKKDSDGLRFLGNPGYVPTHEIDITVIMIPLANDYTPL